MPTALEEAIRSYVEYHSRTSQEAEFLITKHGLLLE